MSQDVGGCGQRDETHKRKLKLEILKAESGKRKAEDGSRAEGVLVEYAPHSTSQGAQSLEWEMGDGRRLPRNNNKIGLLFTMGKEKNQAATRSASSAACF